MRSATLCGPLPPVGATGGCVRVAWPILRFLFYKRFKVHKQKGSCWPVWLLEAATTHRCAERLQLAASGGLRLLGRATARAKLFFNDFLRRCSLNNLFFSLEKPAALTDTAFAERQVKKFCPSLRSFSQYLMFTKGYRKFIRGSRFFTLDLL